MIELLDTFPDINVQPAEYKRLLGFPRERTLEGRVRELADEARAWYVKYGRPWVYARQADTLEIQNGTIRIDGTPFASKPLQKALQQAEAHNVILVAVCAGAEVEREAHKLWMEEKPDEYFFMEMYGSAVVEHLITMAGARLCAWAQCHDMAVLPHYSPGYPDWDISEQPRLLDLMRRTFQQPFPCAVDVLDSGMLRPKKSLLAVFGLTHGADRVRRLTDLVPCESCSFASCQYRRTPYVRAPEHSQTEGATSSPAATATEELTAMAVPLDHRAKYTTSTKALRRWAKERLTLDFKADGSIDALFRYDGTTCTNMGRPLAFDYYVNLGPRHEGYVIREQRCGPAAGDVGHTYMCRYMNNAEHLMVAIDRERALLGQPLNDILSWQRLEIAPGCYCEPASRKHKWGLALETIHYALVERERRR